MKKLIVQYWVPFSEYQHTYDESVKLEGNGTLCHSIAKYNGDYHQEFIADYSKKSFELYAQKYGHDYKRFCDPEINFFHPTWEQINTWFNDDIWNNYDQVLYADTDILALPWAGDIFTDANTYKTTEGGTSGVYVLTKEVREKTKDAMMNILSNMRLYHKGENDDIEIIKATKFKYMSEKPKHPFNLHFAGNEPMVDYVIDRWAKEYIEIIDNNWNALTGLDKISTPIKLKDQNFAHLRSMKDRLNIKKIHLERFFRKYY